MDTETLLKPERSNTHQPEVRQNVVPITAPALVPADAAQSQDFIKAVFGPVTEKPVWIQSLGNDRDGGELPRQLATRDTSQIEGFIKKWDQIGRGAFFCVATINGPKRNKETVAEMIGLHVDIDFKDIDATPEDVDRKLAGLRFPPSRIHASGNGRHCFWLFKEAMLPPDKERIEAALKLICDLVGGDQVVAQCCALMRLPGTHNTKFGKWIEVTVLSDTPARYELDDLEEWLSEASPVILRKVRPEQVYDNNPFLAHAKANGFKPTIDVEKRLRGMSYMAGGDAAVHGTQLAVSASLLTGGMMTDDVVGLILEATRGAAAGYGGRWNWTREESAIRKMCADWLRKHPQGCTPAHSGKPQVSAGELVDEIQGTVVTIAPKRAQKQMGGGTPMHVILGAAMLATIRGRDEEVLVTNGEVWRYQDRLWSVENHEQSWINAQIEAGCQALEIHSTIKIINEARQWLLRQPELLRKNVPWDNHGMVPTRSGLLDTATMILEEARPGHFATWRIECDYDVNAACPWWLTMLDDFFADRPIELRSATISTVQEVLGAALMENKPRALTRALILEGPSEAGKTRILDVLSGLFGDRPIATPLDALGSTHGLMEFKRRAPWVLHEAFNAGQWHMSSVVKSILTGDPVQINVKNGAITTQRIKAPVFWGTNHPPQFKEATKAIVNRLIVIKCRIVFDPKKLIGAAAEARKRGFAEPSELILETEMSGLLNWAVAGLLRCLARGHIETTPEVVGTMDKVRQDSNMVAGFLEECAEYSTSAMISVADFSASFAVWWMEVKGIDRNLPSNETIGRALSALGDNRIIVDSKEMRDMTRRYFGGLHLNNTGLDYWQGASSEGLAKGKTARVSAGRSDVNRIIPEGWCNRDSVIRMRALDPMTATHDGSGMTVDLHDTSPRF